MNYSTSNELAHFVFTDAVIGEIESTKAVFNVYMDNVTILPENSCNRDIRTMRANEFTLKILTPTLEEVMKEGFKKYNADGVLTETVDDVVVAPEEYKEVFEGMRGATIYSIENRDGRYIFSVDADDGCYVITVSGSADREEWDRFLVKEM